MKKFFFPILILSLSLSASSFAAELPAPTVAIHKDWGNTGTVYQYGRYYTSGALDEAAIQKFKTEQGGLVVDLRGITELNCSSRTEADKIGLPYRNVPIDSAQGFKQETIQQIEKIVNEAAKDKPILFSCKTGNRAAAVLAIHLAGEEHLTTAAAMKRAESMGLTSAPLKKKLKSYLEHPNSGNPS
jgi:protein tyrosine phosphatase (PTP) superfamily phosphohydrolase (DUF442 family)